TLHSDLIRCVINKTATTKTYTLSLHDALPILTYTWKRNGTVLEGEVNNTLVINQTGQYSVTVDTSEGCSGSDTVNVLQGEAPTIDRKSTRLNSSHVKISYAVFCLTKNRSPTHR